MLSDKDDNAMMPSILNILSRNPDLAKRLPKFEDKRKLKNEKINGWIEETETVSPLDDLFSMLIPILLSAMEGDVHLAPESYERLPPPLTHVAVTQEANRDWLLPVLSDFMCEERTLNTIEPKQATSAEHRRVPETLTLDGHTRHAFASGPLSELDLDKYVIFLSRDQLRRDPVSSALPFDVSQHSQAKSAVALSMIARLENDMKIYADQQNNGKTPKCVYLLDEDVTEYVTQSSPETQKKIKEAIAHLENLVAHLLSIRESDSAYVNNAIPFIRSQANYVPLPPVSELSQDKEGDKEKEKDDQVAENPDALEKYKFVLKRYCGQESDLWLDYVIGSLLSSAWRHDLQKLNPYFEEEAIQKVYDVAVGAILHANRVGHINRCLSDARDVLSLLQNAVQQEPQEGVNAPLLAGLIQKSESLATNLASKRFFVDPKDETLIYDPRFLVFEFTWNIMLRQAQVILVREFMGALRSGKSMVKQMIMGQGKTTVVGPLLALMLGDGKSLVAQVVPPALLEFSRSIMRSTFSSIMHKRIYTLTCDRASKVDKSLYNKLTNAIKTKGVVISTPTAIKSIQLKLLEMMHLIEDPGVPHHPQMEVDLRELARVLSLFRDGVLIMDEVDLILHPLKSELNFPIGPKLDLDFNPLRWKLPIHLLDAVFYAERGSMSVGFKESNRAVAVLEKIRAIINEGYKQRAMQRNPHIVLLNPDFYHKHLKPVMAEWAILWLESQSLAGLNDQQIADYILEEDRASFVVRRPDLVELVNNTLSPKHKKMLNLCRDWLKSYLPHVLQKIDRVSFGLLSKADYDRAIATDPNMPRTRAKLAVPFVGKDVPSQSSEFAHPDVIIGLTILAYRYEGLRWTDFTDIIASLRSTMTMELGPYNERKSCRRYAAWVREAGGRIKGSRNYKQDEKEKGKDLMDDDDDEKEIVPLRLLKRSNEEMMNKLYKLFVKLPDLIHWYLNDFIFPAYMRHQVIKLSASGQELGGDALFGRRIGFSGTPSDLMPIELGECGYEKGSDGLVLNYMTNPDIVSHEVIEEGWSVKSLLNTIAQANPPYHALIDTGALITGMTNYEVAAYLLDHGLPSFEGVVFLDEFDRKMILVRATRRVMKLAQCGISDKKRFAFYDQVHTTGMDIKHVLNACAVLTLGKDMTFRDYAQGAFRMRGIGRGQTIHLFVIPEIERLMARELKEAEMNITGVSEDKKALIEVAAWLVINSMRSERIQFNQLCIQNVSNVWRKSAFKHLLHNHRSFNVREKLEDGHLRKCLQVFREAIDFSLEAAVPVPKHFTETIANRIDSHRTLIEESEMPIITHVLELVSKKKAGRKEGAGKEKEEDSLEAKKKAKRQRRRRLLNNSAGHFFDAEKVQEQEQEREQQQEQEQEQEIEIEKYVDLAYSRDQEEPTPWEFSTLRSRESVPQFYHAKEFHLYKRPPLPFEDYLLVSDNYFDKRWTGARRIKNVVMVLEWIPSVSRISLMPPRDPKALSGQQEVELHKAFALFDQHNKGSLDRESIKTLINSAIDFIEPPTEEQMDAVMKEFASEGVIDYEHLKLFLQSGKFREEESGRYYVTLSLAEAETIRRIMHIRLERDIIDGTDVTMALRCVPADNMPIDVSSKFKQASLYQSEAAYHSLRFLNCDMYFKPNQMSVLLRALQRSTIRERIVFFERVIGCRRRMTRKWEETPLAKLFSLPHEFALLKQRGQSVRIRESIKAKGLLLYDAFRIFDHHRNGFITAPELYGALEWLGVEVTPGDILDFMRTADTNRDGNIDYREFVEMVRDPNAKLEELEEEDETQDGSNKPLGVEFGAITPKGEEELKALKEKQQAEEKRLEEEELAKEKEFEQKIRREIDEEEDLIDRTQEGGPNPKLLGEGCIKYDFTTGRRPRDVQCRGDIAYKPLFEKKFLKVFKTAMLFIPIPFSPADGIGKNFNQYTVSMELMLDEFPQAPALTAIFNTAMYNEKPANIYVRHDGRVGTAQMLGEEGNETLTAGKWHLVSISVDCLGGMVNVFVDGRVAATLMSEEIAIVDGPFSVGQQLCLFGSKNAAETLGANIKNLWFDARTYSQTDAQGLYENIQYEGSWECDECTFRNPASTIECQACGKFNIITAASMVWTCSVCTFNNASGDVCAICGSPKSS